MCEQNLRMNWDVSGGSGGEDGWRNYSESLVVDQGEKRVSTIRGWLCPGMFDEDEYSQGEGDNKKGIKAATIEVQMNSGKSCQGMALPWLWETRKAFGRFTEHPAIKHAHSKMSLQSLRMSKLSCIFWKFFSSLELVDRGSAGMAFVPPCEYSPVSLIPILGQWVEEHGTGHGYRESDDLG